MGLRRIGNASKGRYYLSKCLPLIGSYCYCTKESTTRRVVKRRLRVNYQALDSLLPPIVKANSKTQSVVSLIPL